MLIKIRMYDIWDKNYSLDSIHFHSKRKKEKNTNQESFSIY